MRIIDAEAAIAGAQADYLRTDHSPIHIRLGFCSSQLMVTAVSDRVIQSFGAMDLPLWPCSGLMTLDSASYFSSKSLFY